MRKFYLLGMMSFLFSGMAWADDYELSFDDAAIIWNEDMLTWDATTATITFGDEDGDTWGNGALGWLNYVATDLSAYNTLVVKLAEASDEQIEVCVCEDGFWDSDAYSSTYITAGETEYTLDLTTATRGDGESLDLTNINLIVLRTNWTNYQKIVLSSVYLTYVEDEDSEASDSYEVLENYASLDFLYDDEGTAEDDTDDVAYGNYCSYTYESNLYETSFSSNGGNNAVQFHFSEAVDISGYDYLVIELAEAANVNFMPGLASGTTDSYWGATEISYCQSGSTTYKVALDTCAYTGTTVGTVVILTEWGFTDASLDFESIRFEVASEEEEETEASSEPYDMLENYTSLDFLYDDEGTAEDDTDDVAYGNYCSYTYESNLFETSFSSNGGNNAVQFHLSEAIDISGYDYLIIELAEAANVNFMPGLASGTTDSYWGATEISICQSGSTTYTIALDTCAYTGTTVGTVVILTEWGFTDASLDFESIRFEAASEDAESDDTLTGIQSVENSEAAEDDVYYNLSGVRVANPSKGLYIKNGKKVIIK